MIKRVLVFDDRLRQYALSLTRNLEDAEDLLQDTYVKIMQKSDSYTEQTNLKAWVFAIMRNTFINNYRRNQRSVVFYDDTDSSVYTSTATRSSDAADLPLYVSEITCAVSSIGKSQREAFELYLDGYPYQDIAEMLQISIGTVKSRIFFARQKLMNYLIDYSLSSRQTPIA